MNNNDEDPLEILKLPLVGFVAALLGVVVVLDVIAGIIGFGF